MKTTYEKLFEFNSIGGLYLEKIKEETKVKYAIQKIAKALTKKFEAYNEMRSDIERDFCYTEKDVIIRDDKGNYKYTKENEKKKDNAIRELKYKEIEFSEYFVLEKPIDLLEYEIDAFENIVVSPEMASELRKAFQ